MEDAEPERHTGVRQCNSTIYYTDGGMRCDLRWGHNETHRYKKFGPWAQQDKEIKLGDPSIARQLDSRFAITTDGRLIKPSSGEVLPEDEPLILMRARDRLVLPTLRKYREFCVADGCNEWFLALLDETIARFEKFEREHPERMKQPGITRGK